VVIKEADFITSSPDFRKCPTTKSPEFAFVGRSNVGKSSLINCLVNRKSLAKTSVKPGKTQLINHFLINKQWYLVDLPGYGWAKVSKKLKSQWQKMLNDYFLYRENLACVFTLIDSRLKPQPVDITFLKWLGENKIPFAIIFTKADKVSKNLVSSNILTFKKTMMQDWEEIPDSFISSAKDKRGREEILDYIDRILKSIQ